MHTYQCNDPPPPNDPTPPVILTRRVRISVVVFRTPKQVPIKGLDKRPDKLSAKMNFKC